jgi:hypothetical protein
VRHRGEAVLAGGGERAQPVLVGERMPEVDALRDPDGGRRPLDDVRAAFVTTRVPTWPILK